MMGDPWAPAILAGGVALMGKIVFDWLGRGRNGNGHVSTDFWRMELRVAIREVLDARQEMMISATREIESRLDTAIYKLDEILRRMETRGRR